MNKTLGTEDEDFVIAMDTDSVYITMDKLVKKVISKKQTRVRLLIS